MNPIASRCARVLCTLFGCLAAQGSFAATSMNGTCAMLAALPPPFAYQYGQDPGPAWGLNMLATFNFTTGVFEGNVILINPAASHTTQQPITVSAPITVSDGPFPGSSVVTATVTGLDGPHTFRWNVLPVNRGNTLLMQWAPGEPGSADSGLAATCQF
jgi:hypothetical protein